MKSIQGSSLTAKSIKTMSIGQVFYRDRLEVRKIKDDVVYYSNIMVNGRRTRTLLGKESLGYNLTRARQDLNKVYVSASSEAGYSNTYFSKTFEDASAHYLDLLERTSGSNIAQKRQQLRDHLIPFWGKLRIRDLTQGLVQEYVARRQSLGASNATICRELSVFSHMGNTLVDHGGLSNPFPTPKKPRENTVTRGVIPDKDFSKLLLSAKNDVSPDIYLFLIVARNSGMRHSEILSLRWEHVNFDASTVFLPEAKAGPRHQPISNEGMSALRIRFDELGEDAEWIFPSQSSKTGHLTYVKSQWARVVKDAGLDGKGYTIHSIRHTVVSTLAAQNVNLATIKEISGHKSDAAVNRYMHSDRDQVRRALDGIKFGARISPNT